MTIKRINKGGNFFRIDSKFHGEKWHHTDTVWRTTSLAVDVAKLSWRHMISFTNAFWNAIFFYHEIRNKFGKCLLLHLLKFYLSLPFFIQLQFGLFSNEYFRQLSATILFGRAQSVCPLCRSISQRILYQINRLFHIRLNYLIKDH